MQLESRKTGIDFVVKLKIIIVYNAVIISTIWLQNLDDIILATYERLWRNTGSVCFDVFHVYNERIMSQIKKKKSSTTFELGADKVIDFQISTALGTKYYTNGCFQELIPNAQKLINHERKQAKLRKRYEVQITKIIR